MTDAIFRETENVPAERGPSALSRVRDAVDSRDVLAALGFVGLSVGLAMAWLPLAFIVSGSLLLAFATYTSLPRAT